MSPASVSGSADSTASASATSNVAGEHRETLDQLALGCHSAVRSSTQSWPRACDVAREHPAARRSTAQAGCRVAREALLGEKSLVRARRARSRAAGDRGVRTARRSRRSVRVEVNTESACPLCEQLRCVARLQRLENDLDLAREMEALATRREDGDVRAARRALAQARLRPARPARSCRGRAASRRASMCVARSPSASSVDVIAGRTCSGSRSGASSTNQTPSGKAGARSGGCLDRQARLADAARSRQR